MRTARSSVHYVARNTRCVCQLQDEANCCRGQTRSPRVSSRTCCPAGDHAMIDMQLTTQTFHLGRFTDLQPLRPRMKARPRILPAGEPATVTAQFQPSIPASSARRSRRSSSPQPGRLLGYAGRKGKSRRPLPVQKSRPVPCKEQQAPADAPRYTPRHPSYRFELDLENRGNALVLHLSRARKNNSRVFRRSGSRADLARVSASAQIGHNGLRKFTAKHSYNQLREPVAGWRGAVANFVVRNCHISHLKSVNELGLLISFRRRDCRRRSTMEGWDEPQAS